jgi:transposase
MASEVWFSRQDCTPRPLRARCTRAKREPRIIRLQARDQHEALRAARERQTTPTFRERYAARAGIESTHAQAVRCCGLHYSRYLGLAKTHLQHVVTAVAVNLVRLGERWAGRAKAPTRRSPFAALNPAVAT